MPFRGNALSRQDHKEAILSYSNYSQTRHELASRGPYSLPFFPSSLHERRLSPKWGPTKPFPTHTHRNQQEDKLKAKLNQQQQNFNKNPSLKTPINTTRIPRTTSTYTCTKHEQHEKTNAKWQGLPSPNVMAIENLRRAIHKKNPSFFLQTSLQNLENG
jgi:hypothetical protein